MAVIRAEDAPEQDEVHVRCAGDDEHVQVVEGLRDDGRLPAPDREGVDRTRGQGGPGASGVRHRRRDGRRDGLGVLTGRGVAGSSKKGRPSVRTTLTRRIPSMSRRTTAAIWRAC